MDQDAEKRIAAEAAALLVEDGMRVGLGTGSTVAFLLPAIAARGLGITCVATSVATEEQARSLGMAVVDAADVDHLDLAIDGADQISPGWWLVKGGGAAHTREKVVASMADRFVVIADSSKTVERLHAPIPLELLRFGLASTLRLLDDVTIRGVADSPDGNVIADYQGDASDPANLAAWLGSVPGVVEHGLFPPSMVDDVIIGRGAVAERLPKAL
jgi:ribose 5-phosphate isomerase A